MFKKEFFSGLEPNGSENVYQKLIQTKSLLQLSKIENEQILGNFACRLISSLQSKLYRYQTIYRLAHTVVSYFLRKDPTLKNHKLHYKKWIGHHDHSSSNDLKAIKKHINSFAWKPKFTIILFIESQERKDVDRSMASLYSQSYANWELSFLLNLSKNPKATQTVKEAVRFYRQSYLQAVQLVNATDFNDIKVLMDHSKGQYIVFLSSGDLLSPHALYMLAFALNLNDKADLLYSDEDFIDKNDERFSPYFKPDWNFDLFLSRNYIHNLCAIRREAIKKVKKNKYFLRKHKLYSLLLELTEITIKENIIHLPFILYHNFTSSMDLENLGINNKSFLADPIALRKHFQNKGVQAIIEKSGTNKGYRIRYRVPEPSPLVSVIIPTAGKNMTILSRLVKDLIRSTTYQPIEVLLVPNNINKTKKLSEIEGFKSYSHNQIRVAGYDGPFNHSAINNYAVRLTAGSLLCFLNDDLLIKKADWLVEMVGHALRPEIGAVGVKLYYPNNLIQHAGLILGCGGTADHAFRWLKPGKSGYFGHVNLIMNYSAVTAACMVLRKNTFEMVGGFDEDLQIAFNDVDLCLKIQEKGYRILWTPYTELYHYESLSRSAINKKALHSQFRKDKELLQQKWATELIADPAFNPNLSLRSDIFTLASTPRISKPWDSFLQ